MTAEPPRPPSAGPPAEATRVSARVALFTVLALVAVAVVLFVLVASNLGSGGSDTEVGTETDSDLFVAGQATRLGEAVREGGPLLLPDLLGGSRDIFLQHIGGNDWLAIEAHPPGAPRCALRWDQASRVFSDSCSPSTYPADGRGLVTYPTRVDDDGRVVVDLRDPSAPATTSAPGGASPSVTGPPS